MKKFSLVVAGLAVIAAASSAFATDIVNKDDTPYDFMITCGAKQVRGSIGSNTDSKGAVDSGCTVQLKDSNSITVKGSKVITIQGGKISQ